MRRLLSPAAILLALICLLSLYLQLAAARRDSVTLDETIHIYAGYSYLTKHDFRLDPEHPPLLKEIGAVPLLFMHLNPPGDKSWNDAAPYYEDHWHEARLLGEQFLYSVGNDHNRIVFWSRLPFILLTLVLGIFAWFWANKLYGWKAGLLAAFLVLLLPTLLAHGHLDNTDLVVLFIFVGVYFWGKFLQFRRARDLLPAALFAGCAFASKYTAGLLLPILLILALGRLYLCEKSARLWRPYLAGFLALLVIGFLVTWASYQFGTRVPPPAPSANPTWGGSVPPSAVRPLLLHARWLFLPAEFYKGLFMIFHHALAGHLSFLLGETSRSGWWYYFPVAILFKTPLPAFLFLGLAIVFHAKLRPRSGDDFDEFLLLAPALTFLVLSMFSKADLGVRHVLPIFPFLLVYAAKSINLLDLRGGSVPRRDGEGREEQPEQPRRARQPGKRGLLPAAGFAALIVWYLACALPPLTPQFNYIAYFNELAGGPSGGYRLLSDSNIDWGQDLNRLREYLRAHRISVVSVECPPEGDPSYAGYGIGATPLEPGVPWQRYAVVGTTLLNRPELSWLRYYPAVQITPGLFLIDLRQPRPVADP